MGMVSQEESVKESIDEQVGLFCLLLFLMMVELLMRLMTTLSLYSN